MTPLLVAFAGGPSGTWRVRSMEAVAGPGLSEVDRVAVVDRGDDTPADARWILRGATGHERYVERAEREALAARQEGLGRPSATRAALIPIRKSDAWWDLAQDERRAIFEARSHHIVIGLRYLPAVARRLHHSRELGEPFDFLTWFEFAPEHAGAFDELLAALRETDEWAYVEREVEIRLER